MEIVKLAAAALACATAFGAAAEWPDKPIHVIVPFTAGSGTDIVARTVFEPVGRALGQPVTVEVMVAIDGSKYGYLQKIVLPNGNQISLEEGQKEERNP